MRHGLGGVEPMEWIGRGGYGSGVWYLTRWEGALPAAQADIDESSLRLVVICEIKSFFSSFHSFYMN